MTATVRLRTTAGTIVEGDLEGVAPHFVKVCRTAVEERGTRTEHDRLLTRLHKPHIVSVVVSAITDGKNLMLNDDELCEATLLAIEIGCPVEIRTTPLTPADFAQELCQLDQATEEKVPA